MKSSAKVLHLGVNGGIDAQAAAIDHLLGGFIGVAILVHQVVDDLFNHMVHGAKAAANTYFAKDLSDLSLAECASIIAITNYPTYYNPAREGRNRLTVAPIVRFQSTP